MKLTIWLLGAVLCLVASSAVVAEPEPENRFRLGLYVVVDDMTESRDYYRRLFEAEPVYDLDDFVAFNLSGGLFSLFDAGAYEHTLDRGNGVVPYIRVRDIGVEFERVSSFTDTMVHEQVVDEGPIKLFMFLDPSGNPLEFYALGAEESAE